MSRLIDLDELEKKQISKSTVFVSTEEKLYRLVDDIYKAPIVDAVQVVRCKNCKYWKRFYDKDNSNNMCMNTQWLPLTVMERPYTNGEHFCGYGEMKENDNYRNKTFL